jgi:hypothetical protein
MKQEEKQRLVWVKLYEQTKDVGWQIRISCQSLV